MTSIGSLRDWLAHWHWIGTIELFEHTLFWSCIVRLTKYALLWNVPSSRYFYNTPWILRNISGFMKHLIILVYTLDRATSQILYFLKDLHVCQTSARIKHPTSLLPSLWEASVALILPGEGVRSWRAWELLQVLKVLHTWKVELIPEEQTSHLVNRERNVRWVFKLGII